MKICDFKLGYMHLGQIVSSTIKLKTHDINRPDLEKLISTLDLYLENVRESLHPQEEIFSDSGIFYNSEDCVENFVRVLDPVENYSIEKDGQTLEYPFPILSVEGNYVVYDGFDENKLEIETQIAHPIFAISNYDTYLTFLRNFYEKCFGVNLEVNESFENQSYKLRKDIVKYLGEKPSMKLVHEQSSVIKKTAGRKKSSHLKVVHKN